MQAMTEPYPLSPQSGLAERRIQCAACSGKRTKCKDCRQVGEGRPLPRRSSRPNAEKQSSGSISGGSPSTVTKCTVRKRFEVEDDADDEDEQTSQDGSNIIVSIPKAEPSSSSLRKPNQARRQRRKQLAGPKRRQAGDTSLSLLTVNRPAVAIAQQLLYVHKSKAVSIPEPRIRHIVLRLDSSPALLHATSAVVSIANSRLHSRPAEQRRQPALGEYMRAVSEVNSSSEVTEPLLLAISLFWYLETDCGTEAGEKFHTRGFHSLILANPSRWARNPVGWTILMATRPAASEAYIAIGKPSPFEDDSWFNPDIPAQDCARAGVLTKLAHQILFKIPRLSGLLRKVRSGQFFDLFVAGETIALAHRILRIRDGARYFWMFERCERRDTESSIDRKVAPTSLHFTSLDELDWFIDYSRARLTIVTLCLALQRLIWRHRVPQIETLRKEQQELVVNILSCWEQCMENQRFQRAMRPAVVPLYGALKQMQYDYGAPTDEVLKWLDLRSVLAFANVADFNGSRHLAATWELYCGGPSEGTLYSHWVD